MIRPIVRDVFFLALKSEPATQGDLAVDRDLRDTLQANRERCVGMAANMIGVRKRVIIVSLGFVDVVMYNPVLLSKDTLYEAEEGCLSLDGTRKTTRYRETSRLNTETRPGRDVASAIPGGLRRSYSTRWITSMA